MSQNKILFNLTGSIACFKAGALISKLVQTGFDVQTVATPSALKFIGEATLEGLTGRKVLTETFASGDLMGHINWSKWADLTIVYPATANTLNKLANGVADNLVGALFLAHDFKKPYVIAPAMNSKMLEHPATQESLKKLRSFGVTIVEPSAGALACGDVGAGRLAEPDDALRKINRELAVQTVSKNLESENSTPLVKKILVTLGGTREPIDDVRFITNASSGLTGSLVADYLSDVGHAITAVCAEGAKLPAQSDCLLSFVTFADLDSVLKEELALKYYDAIIHLAAVGDYSVESVETDGVRIDRSSSAKLASNKSVTLHLKPNHKILDRLRSYSQNKNIQVIGFKLTANADEKTVAEKIDALLRTRQTDFVVHNDSSKISSAFHPAKVFDREGKAVAFTHTKQELAETIERIIREASI